MLRFPSDGEEVLGPVAALVSGPATRFHAVSIEAGTCFVGIRLRPGTAKPVLGISPGLITNEVLKGEVALMLVPALGALVQKLTRGSWTVGGVMQQLSSFVDDRCADGGVNSTTPLIDALHVSGGRLPIRDIAALHTMSVRTVHRRITEATGLTPKELAMVIQFHRALRLRLRDGLGVAATALEAGYSDQAHMTRVFRRLGGVSPARLPELALAGLPI